MFRSLIPLAAIALLSAPAAAEMYEVKMMTKGENGDPMVFDPAYLQLEVGDTVKFLATQKGHNAESIKGMAPEGAEKFKGKINEEIEITFGTEGWYGIQCKPHYAMGMVMVVDVGSTEIPDGFLEGRIPKRAMQRFEEAIAMAE